MKTITFKNHQFKIFDEAELAELAEAEFKAVAEQYKKDVELLDSLKPVSEITCYAKAITKNAEDWFAAYSAVASMDFALTRVGAPKGWYPKIKTDLWQLFNKGAGGEIAEAR